MSLAHSMAESRVPITILCIYLCFALGGERVERGERGERVERGGEGGEETTNFICVMQ